MLVAVVPGASAAKGGVRAVLQALAEAQAAGASAKNAAPGEQGGEQAIAEARAAEASAQSAARGEQGSEQALAEARAGKASAQSAAQGELGSAKAIEEAPKATSLTTITDEMNADPYHPDWQRYVGGEPRAVGADVVGGGAKEVGAVGQKLPSALLENLTGYANPKDIRFTQDSVSNTFKDGQTLQSTIDGLKSGKIISR